MRALRHTLLLGLTLVSACSLQVNYDGSHFACTDGQCPGGQRCVAGLCERQPDAGFVPPPDASSIDASKPADSGPDASTFCDGVDEILYVDGTCFVLDRTLRTWTGARDHCETLGTVAHLVYFTDAGQNSIASNLGASSPPGLSSIGATDGNGITGEGDWVWLDGRSFPPTFNPDLSFKAWNTNEPNDGNANMNEDCAAIRLSTVANGLWDDRTCGSSLPSVCAIEVE